jgi:hypothetical protein
MSVVVVSFVYVNGCKKISSIIKCRLWHYRLQLIMYNPLTAIQYCHYEMWNRIYLLKLLCWNETTNHLTHSDVVIVLIENVTIYNIKRYTV